MWYRWFSRFPMSRKLSIIIVFLNSMYFPLVMIGFEVLFSILLVVEMKKIAG